MKQKKHKRLKWLLLINLFSLTGYYVFTPFYALFAHNLGITPKYIGFIWGGYSLATAVFLLFFGKYENRRIKETAIIIGYCMYIIGGLLFLRVHNVKELVIVLGINALGAGITLPAYKALFAQSQDKGRESEEWSWLDGGNMFAAALGSAIGGLVIGIFGFSGLFVTMAAIQFLAAIAFYSTFRSSIKV